MKNYTLAAMILTGLMTLPGVSAAQNVAIVNGKAVPKARVELLLKRVAAQAAAAGQALPPNIDAMARDQVVLEEIFAQEALRQGVSRDSEYTSQLDAARQNLLISTLFRNYQKNNPVTEAEMKSEYEKLKAGNAGKEYRARHILVDKEDEAKSLIAQIQKGGKFEELARKNSKDTGSAENGGDLDFASPGTFVKEFSQAMTALQKGEMTSAPVRSQFGWHIIRLDDVREAQFPAYDEVKDQLKNHMTEQKLANYRDELRRKAKMDYKFSAE